MKQQVDIRSEAFRVKENTENEDEIVIEGIALPYDTQSRNGIIYTEESIRESADSLVGKPFLFNHDPGQVLGRVTEVNPTKNCLRFKAVADKNKEKVRDIKNGYVSTVSIQAMVEETEDKDNRVNIKEFLELSSAPIPGFKEAEAQAQAVRIETFDATEARRVIINEPNIEGAQEEKWDPAEKNEYSSEEKYYDAHTIWFKENPDSVDDVAFEVAREKDGKLEVNYEALNSAYDLAKTDDDLRSDDVIKLRSLLKDLKKEWFPDREPLDADSSEDEGKKDTQNQPNKNNGDTMEDEDKTQEQDIEDLGDAMDWLEANAPQEVVDMIVDVVRGDEEESNDEEEESKDEEDKEDDKEEAYKEVMERLEKLEEKFKNEEVESSKQVDGKTETEGLDVNSLAKKLKKINE